MIASEGAEFQYHSERCRPARRSRGPSAGRSAAWTCSSGWAAFPVLNGLNVAIPDDTITVVLGPSGTGKSVLIKHLIGLMFPDSGDVIVKGQSVPKPDDAQAAGAAPQDRRAVPGRRPVRVDVGVRQRRVPSAPAHRHVRGADRRRSSRQRLTDVGLADAMDDMPQPALRRHAQARRLRPRAGDGAGRRDLRRARLGS